MNRIKPLRHGQFLVEFLITLIIFTFTSTIMFQFFVRGSEISAEAYDLNRAVVRAESIAEEVIASGGDPAALDGRFVPTPEGYRLYFDGDWKETDAAGGEYTVEIGALVEGSMLVSDIVIKKGGTEIYSVQAKRYLGMLDDGNTYKESE